jgi:hypothetical protein
VRFFPRECSDVMAALAGFSEYTPTDVSSGTNKSNVHKATYISMNRHWQRMQQF